MPANPQARDTATPFMAAAFAILAALVLWDTTSYTDADSFVFPRTIAIVLMVLSISLALQWLFGFGKTNGQAISGASNVRRIALAAAMLGGALAMPYLGFLLAGLIAFAVILVTAMHDPWTPYRLVVYPLAGAVIVGGFYLLFSRALQVPLPTGLWTGF